MFIAGVAAYVYRRRRGSGREITMDRRTATRDIGFFLVFYAVAAGIGLVPLPLFLKLIAAFFLIAAYVVHVVRTIRFGGETEGEAPEGLTFWFTRSPAPTWAVVGQ